MSFWTWSENCWRLSPDYTKRGSSNWPKDQKWKTTLQRKRQIKRLSKRFKWGFLLFLRLHNTDYLFNGNFRKQKLSVCLQFRSLSNDESIQPSSLDLKIHSWLTQNTIDTTRRTAAAQIVERRTFRESNTTQSNCVHSTQQMSKCPPLPPPPQFTMRGTSNGWSLQLESMKIT